MGSWLICRTALVGVLALALYGTAEAANPAKGSTYVGTRRGGTTSLTKKVSLKVAPNATSATALLYCGSSRQPSGAPRFKITNGRFRAVRKTGTVTLWTLSGHFVSKTKATATLNVVTTCDGKGGAITLEKK